MAHYVRPERAFTMEHIPEEPALLIYGTVDIWTETALEFGNPDRSGWVSSLTQPDEPVESREGVTPLFAATLPLDEDNAADVIRILEDLGVADSEDGSTIYASDPKCYDLASDETWAYAIHAHIEHFDTTKGERVETKVRILK